MFLTPSRVASTPAGPEGGVSEAADSSVRPRAAESGAERFVPTADQARLGPASTGTPPTQMLTPGSCDRPRRSEESHSGSNRNTVSEKYSLKNSEGHLWYRQGLCILLPCTV